MLRDSPSVGHHRPQDIRRGLGLENIRVFHSTDGGNSRQPMDIRLQPYFVYIALFLGFTTDNIIIVSTGTLNSDNSKWTGAIF
jgi:hypothetical protein